MSFLSSAKKKIQKARKKIHSASQQSIKLSAGAAKKTVSGSIDTHKKIVAGDFKGAAKAKMGQHKASLRDTFKSGVKAGSAINAARLANHRIMTPKPIQDLEGKAGDEFNRFMGTDAGKILGYILKAIPLTAPYAWAYEAAKFVAMAEQVRVQINAIQKMQDKARLLATLEKQKFVYDESLQSVRASQPGDAGDLPEYRYVPGRGGFVPIKKLSFSGLATVGLLAGALV